MIQRHGEAVTSVGVRPMPGQHCDDSVNSHTQIRVLLGNTSET